MDLLAQHFAGGGVHWLKRFVVFDEITKLAAFFIANRTFQAQTYTVAFDGPKGAILKTPGDRESRDVLKVEVPANEVRAVRVFVTLPPAAITTANMSAAFVVATPSTQDRAETTFLSGAANAP